MDCRNGDDVVEQKLVVEPKEIMVIIILIPFSTLSLWGTNRWCNGSGEGVVVVCCRYCWLVVVALSVIVICSVVE